MAEYTFYDPNWTVLQKIKYLEKWFKDKALDVDTLVIASEQEGAVLYITVSGTAYNGKEYVSDRLSFDLTELYGYTDEKVKEEADAREDADASLEDRLTALIAQSVESEAVERKAADEALEENITAGDSAIEDALADEIAQREAGDNALETAINTVIEDSATRLTIDVDKDYVVTVSLYNKADDTISTGTIDLPLESVVVDGRYDADTKSIILTLDNGDEVDIPVGDLVSGLVSESAFTDAVDELQKAIADETDARESAYEALQSSISEVTESLEEIIENEKTARIEADSALQEAIGIEAAEREDADSILNEDIERVKAEVAEKQDKGDYATAADLEAETAEREAADKSLDERVTKNTEDIEAIEAGGGGGAGIESVQVSDGIIRIGLDTGESVFGLVLENDLEFRYEMDGKLEEADDKATFSLYVESVADGAVYPATYNVVSSDETVVSITQVSDNVFEATAASLSIRGTATLTITAISMAGEEFGKTLDVTIEADPSILYVRDSNGDAGGTGKWDEDAGTATIYGFTYGSFNASSMTCSLTSTYYDGDLTDIVIDKVWLGDDEYTVTSMDSNAFRDASEITSVTLGSGITTLPQGCFRDCSSLEKVDISNITSMSSYVFEGCTNLKDLGNDNVLNENLTTLPTYCFCDCSSLEKVDISNITSIPANGTNGSQFEGCTNLKDLGNDNVLNENLTSLPYYCFHNCSSLEKVDISNVTGMNSEAFYGCTNLKDLGNDNVLNENLTTLPYGCFRNCSSLEKVDISNVTSMPVYGSYGYHFYGCSSLAQIKIGLGLNRVPSYGIQMREEDAHVYYEGTEDDREAMSISSSGTSTFRNAEWHYEWTDPIPDLD